MECAIEGKKEILALTAKLDTSPKRRRTARKETSVEELTRNINGKRLPPKTLRKNGKSYRWLIKHQMRTLHKAEDCRLEAKEEDSANNTEGNLM